MKAHAKLFALAAALVVASLCLSHARANDMAKARLWGWTVVTPDGRKWHNVGVLAQKPSLEFRSGGQTVRVYPGCYAVRP